MPDLSPKLTPHEGQQAVLDSDARTRVVVKGRQWGGSTLIALDVVETAIKEPGTLAWIFAPQYECARGVWQYCTDLSPPADAITTPPEIRFYNGSVIKFFSASSAVQLSDREDLDPPEYVAIDMADGVTKGEFRQITSAASLEDVGRRLFVGTPCGYAEETDEYPGSWLHDYFTDGPTSGTDTESWRFPTASNPLIDDATLAEQSEMVDKETAEQEFDGRWK